MKTYKAILLSVLGLIVVVSGAYVYLKDDKVKPTEALVKGTNRAFQGELVRAFEGDNKLTYSFNVPENATTTLSMGDALVKVTEDDNLLAALYMSYEGGRGYSSLDYITNNIATHVRGVTTVGTTTIGGVLWTVAKSNASEWHVGQVGDGQWLMIVENKIASHDKTMEMLESLVTK